MIPEIILSALAGVAVGCLYFALLWKSAQLLTGSAGYGVFALAALARMALVLAGVALLFAMGSGLPAIAAALLGFVAARVVLTRYLPAAAAERS